MAATCFTCNRVRNGSLFSGHLKSSRVITVGDDPSFAEHGGAIQLVTIRKRLRFIINLKAPGFAGVDLDSRLLSLALEIKE